MEHNLPDVLNPLDHTGTSQYERLAEELQADYVQIEERTPADFLEYAAKLAGSIVYYDHRNQPDGDWKVFFSSQVPAEAPHKALFLAFLKLLEALNEHANGLKEEHLNYYYQDILRFTKEKTSARYLHAFLEISGNLKEKMLEAGTTFSAGKDSYGKELLFHLVNQVVLNHVKAVKVLTAYRHPAEFEERLFTTSHPSVLSTAGDPEGKPAFGEPQITFVNRNGFFVREYKTPDHQTMTEKMPAFSLSSSVLNLAEGKRKIAVKLKFLQRVPRLVPADLGVWLTTEEAWFTPRENQVSITAIDSGKTLLVEIELTVDDGPVTAYNRQYHMGNYQADEPILKLELLNRGAENTSYARWKDVKLIDIALSAEVKGVRGLRIQNDLSALDPTRGFSPFGPVPALGNNLYVGHRDIFRNRLLTASLRIRWRDVPQENLGQYYNAYGVQATNSDWKVQAAILDKREWHPLNGQKSIFHPLNAQAEQEITLETQQVNGYERKEKAAADGDWDYRKRFGFLRLTLSAPDLPGFSAFGHRQYPEKAYLKSVDKEVLPQPYTPSLEYLVLDYRTEEVWLSEENTDKFYRETLFGQELTGIKGDTEPIKLLPAYQEEGYLYLGFEHVQAPQAVNLLFTFKEGSAAEYTGSLSADITWSYLSGNRWVTPVRSLVAGDSTERFRRSGIIRLELPQDMDSRHMIMPDNYYWVRATVSEQVTSIDLLESIRTNALELEEITPDHEGEIIGAGELKKPLQNSAGIARVHQENTSFGGKGRENNTEFYSRVSERLRHKDRAVTIWDYERLVLEQFPELYKVKCLNHTNYRTEVAPGHVMVAVIPDLKNRLQNRNPFQPRLSARQRTEVQNFLQQRISPFITLTVENPVYEPVIFSLKVGFHQGYDEGFYGRKLHDEIQQFLSPWAFAEEDQQANSITFSGKLHKSAVLKFIEDRPYVDFVNDFSMYHQYYNPAMEQRFRDEIGNLNGVVDHSSYYSTGTTDKFKLALKTGGTTTLIDLELRMLHGLTRESEADVAKGLLEQLISFFSNEDNTRNGVTKTHMLSLLKSIYNVDKIINLSVYVMLPGGYIMEETDLAKGRTSRSVMVSANQHRIGVYSAGDYRCDGNVQIGIGFMVVEADFIVEVD